MAVTKQKLIHDTFRGGIFLKGLNGFLEIIGAAVLFFVPPDMIGRIVRIVTQSELSEDPHDIFAGFLFRAARDISVSSEFFGGIFLLTHGLIKIFLVAALFRKKIWAYPLAIFVFGMFILYQMYRFALSHSLFMVGLSILDVFVIALTYLEYKNLKAGELKDANGHA